MDNSVDITTIKEPIEPGTYLYFGQRWWRILEADNSESTILVISYDTVCQKAFEEEKEAANWETCSLRKWLNEEFYSQSFSDDEKAAIVESELKDPRDYSFLLGKDLTTKDKVFILSIEEALKYFKDDKDNISKDLRCTFGYYRWWLRTCVYFRRKGMSLNYEHRDWGKGYHVCYIENGLGNKGLSYKLSYNLKNTCDVTGLTGNYSAGVRPAIRLDLNSKFFKDKISVGANGEKLIETPGIGISGNKVVLANPGLESVSIPEGVTEISGHCFENFRKLKKVTLPSTLRTVGEKAFWSCENLETISCASRDVEWKERALYLNCGKLKCGPDLFQTRGTLCSSFKEHIADASDEDLAWLLMFQKDEAKENKPWSKVVYSRIDGKNATAVLSAMGRLMIGDEKVSKKQALKAADYINRNILILDKKSIIEVCDILKKKKYGEIAEEILKNPAISSQRSSETKAKEAGNDREEILPNGTILFGKEKEVIKPGGFIRFGSDEFPWWRILELNEDKTKVLLLQERIMHSLGFNKEENSTVWRDSYVRKWLNGEFIERSFSEDEKKAIIESVVENTDDPRHKTIGGGPTRDKVFLLSFEETQKYFGSDTDRIAVNKNGDRECWNLRSRGTYQRAIGYVDRGGSLYDCWGDDINSTAVCNSMDLRPALWIDLNSDCFKRRLSKDGNGELILSDQPLFAVKNGVLTGISPAAETVSLPSSVMEIGPYCAVHCKELKYVTWENSKIKIDKDSFFDCPELQLPAEFFISKKKADDNFSAFIPNDAKAIAHVIKNQKNKSIWAASAGRWITEESFDRVSEEMREIDPGEICPEWILAAAPFAESFRKCGTVSSKEFKTAAADNYRKIPEIEMLSKKMDHASLMRRIKEESKKDDCWYAAYAVYADEDELSGLIKEMETWEAEGVKGKNRIIKVRGAILLNDTDMAAEYARSLGLYGRYAKLRENCK